MNKRSIIPFLIGLVIMTYGPLEGQTLTVGEVFDYEVGDEFHFRTWGSFHKPDIIDRLTVTEKRFSNDSSTVFYAIVNNGYTYDPTDLVEPFDIVPIIDTEYVSYTNLSTPIFQLQLDDWVKGLGVSKDSLTIDTVIVPDSSLCSTERNAYHVEAERFIRKLEYAKGLGFIYNYHLPIIGFDSHSKKMFYYKKGTTTCGKPDIKSSVPENHISFKIEVFPNPASEMLYITSTSNSHEPVTIEILSLNGEVLMNTFLQTPTIKVSIQNLPAGTYLVRSKTSQLTHTELVVKQ